MSKRRAESNPVSLFPFLAVLLSAMGALILLLVVVSRQAQRSRDLEHRSAAARELAALPPLPDRVSYLSIEPLPRLDLPPVPQPNLPPLPELKDPRPKLDAQKKKLEEELRRWSTPKSTMPSEAIERDRLTQLRGRLAELLAQIREIEKAKLLAEKEKATAASVVRELDARWSKAKSTAEKAENRFSIVPYFGNNGSDREPIYIECRRDRLILQPQGIEIGPLVLGNPLDPENSLAAILRALLAYQRNKGEQPYPLLVVRPDGIATYYIARIALTPVRVEYGYELVSKEMNLDFGTSDAKTKEIAQAIVENAKSKIRRLPGRPAAEEWDLDVADEGPVDSPTTIRDLKRMRSPTREEMESLARGLPSVGEPGAPDDRGLVQGGGSSEQEESRPWRSGSSSSENSRGLADDGNADKPSGRDTVSTGPDSTGPDSSRTENDAGMGRSDSSGSDSRLAERGSIGPGRDRPMTPSAADRLSGLGVSRSLASSTNSGNLSRAGRGRKGAGDAPEPAMVGGPDRPTSPNGDALGEGSVDEGMPLADRSPNPPERPLFPPGADGQTGTDQKVTLGSTERASRAPNGWTSAPSTGGQSSGGQTSNPGMSTARGMTSSTPIGSRQPSSLTGTSANTKSGSATKPPAGAVAGQASSTTGMKASADGSAASASSPNDFQKALMEAAGRSSCDPTCNEMTMPTLQFTNRKSADQKQQGEGGDNQGTGTPDFGPGGTIRETLRRPVVVECREAGITLYPGGQFVKVDPNGDITEVRKAIYKHVAEQMMSWGPPSEIHRWAPYVEFNVRPDGIERYYDLRLSMIESGIEVQKRLVSWKDEIDFPEVFGGARPADQARKRGDATMTR
ncbi:hypothetical protein K2X85_16665 [bacterium]|nr:hypothetical protein [bacterium]